MFHCGVKKKELKNFDLIKEKTVLLVFYLLLLFVVALNALHLNKHAMLMQSTYILTVHTHTI